MVLCVNYRKMFFRKAYWFVKSSVALDVGFLKVSRWPLFKKLQFIFVKYLEIIRLISGVHKFRLGESYVNLFGSKVFYDSPYGIAGYQSMLARHQKMVLESNIANVYTILDVGSNVGFFSMMIRNLYSKSNIYAIEPVPQIFECLRKNLNDNLSRVFNLAISNTNAKVKMSFKKDESAFSHVIRDSELSKLNESNIIEVEAVTLDFFCIKNGISNIDVLKIDTESFELEVLEGAKNTLSKTRFLHIEINIKDNDRYTFSQINGLLFSDKYNFQLISFRNFTDKGDGSIPVGDFLYKNLMIK